MLQNRITAYVSAPVATVPAGMVACQLYLPPAVVAASIAIQQQAYQQALVEVQERRWRTFLHKRLFSVWN